MEYWGLALSPSLLPWGRHGYLLEGKSITTLKLCIIIIIVSCVCYFQVLQSMKVYHTVWHGVHWIQASLQQVMQATRDKDISFSIATPVAKKGNNVGYKLHDFVVVFLHLKRYFTVQVPVLAKYHQLTSSYFKSLQHFLA